MLLFNRRSALSNQTAKFCGTGEAARVSDAARPAWQRSAPYASLAEVNIAVVISRNLPSGAAIFDNSCNGIRRLSLIGNYEAAKSLRVCCA